MAERQMTEHERKVYKQKMKAIKEALARGDDQAAERHVAELKAFFALQ